MTYNVFSGTLNPIQSTHAVVRNLWSSKWTFVPRPRGHVEYVPARWRAAWCVQTAGWCGGRWWRGRGRVRRALDEESAWAVRWTAPTDRWTRATRSTSRASHARSLSFTRPQQQQVVKVIWHKAASQPHTDGSVVFGRWRQSAPHPVNLTYRYVTISSHPNWHPHRTCADPCRVALSISTAGHVRVCPGPALFRAQNCSLVCGNLDPI